LRDLLEWAVVHDQRARVALLASHGVDVIGASDGRPTPIALAQRNGHGEIVAMLRELGAAPARLDAVDEFVAAALCGDTAAVSAAPDEVVSGARARRPALIVWAAAQGRIEAVELIAAAGFDVNALGRSDLPVEQPWQTALHTAVERGNAELARRLLALGADRDARDARFNGTPLDWAQYFGNSELVAMLTPDSSEVSP
jgi:ankyrin repeat protein